MSRILRGCSIGVVMLFLTSAIAYGQATSGFQSANMPAGLCFQIHAWAT